MIFPEYIGRSGPIGTRPTAAQVGITPWFWWATDALTVPGGQTLYMVVLESGILVWKTIGGAGSTLATGNVDIFVNAATGNNANPGTAALPVQTIPAALALRPAFWTAHCRINLIGVGPFVVPADFVFDPGNPVGPDSQPCVFVGSFTQIATGVVQSVLGATMTPVVPPAVVDTWRGASAHGLTGTMAGKYYGVATNTATVLSSIGNTFGAAALDTFEILRPAAVISMSGAPKFIGPNTLVFWGINFTNSAGGMDICDSANVVFDNCEGVPTAGKVTTTNARIAMCGVNDDLGTVRITDVGTQFGASSFYLHGGTTAFGFGVMGYAKMYGYLICEQMEIRAGNGGTGLAGGFVEFKGLDLSMVGQVNSNCVLYDQGSVATASGYLRIVGSGANSVGLFVSTATYEAFAAVGAITNCGLYGIFFTNGATGFIRNMSGSTGNAGFGLRVSGRAVVTQVTNTLTGALGDVAVDLSTGRTWAEASTPVASSQGMSGTAYNYFGGFTGAAGVTTVYLPMGGFPGAVNGVNNSPTTLRLPVTPAREARRLRIEVLQNNLATATTVTVVNTRAGVQSLTILTLSIPAGTTGMFTDSLNATSFITGDEIDLQLTNTAGGAGNTLTCSASLQAA